MLGTWEPKGDLILDISIYSLSDSEHWFKYLTFMPDASSAEISAGGGIEHTTLKKVYHDPQHGWVAGFRRSAPPTSAIEKVFFEVMEVEPFDSAEQECQWWEQLPSVSVVTGLLSGNRTGGDGNRRRLLVCLLVSPGFRKSTTSPGGNGTECRSIRISVSFTVYYPPGSRLYVLYC